MKIKVIYGIQMLSLNEETLTVKQGETVLGEVQLPLVEQILVFGKSQLTTQVIRACLSSSFYKVVAPNKSL